MKKGLKVLVESPPMMTSAVLSVEMMTILSAENEISG